MSLLQIVTCPICFTELQSPVSISCGHTFCKNCLLQLISKQQYPSCPLCRKPIFAPLGGEWATDDLLMEVISIVKENGEAVLEQQFQEMVMCLSCGLTPVAPTVLACQHLFCQDCIKEHLKEELICPACNEWAAYFPNTIPVNTKYTEIIEWYEHRIANSSGMKEEKFKNPNQDTTSTVCGMPLFFFDQPTHIKQNQELLIVEDRYQQLLKIATNGSGLFPVITLIRSVQDLPMYADLVSVNKIRQLNTKQTYVQTQGVARLMVKSVYSIGSSGNKIPFSIEYFRNFPGQLWMCDFEILVDNPKQGAEKLALMWFKINAILQAGYDELPEQMKELFIMTFQQVMTHKKGSFHDELLQLQDASLLLARMLSIPMKQYQRLYYSDNILLRVQYIYQHLFQIQNKILAIVGQHDKIKKVTTEEEPLEELENIANLPYVDDEDDEQELALLQFSNLNLSQTIFVNCFRMENLIQHTN